MIFNTEIIYSVPEMRKDDSDLCVKIHGAIMKLIPTEYADELHRNSLQPFSMYCLQNHNEDSITLHISAFSHKARIISDALLDCDKLNIYGLREPIKKTNCSSKEADIQKEADEIGNNVRLSILTPAIYRSSGRSFCTPDLSRYFRSTAEKFVEFTGEGNAEHLCGIISGIHLTNYSLSGKSYNISGNIYNGMTGFADIPIAKKTGDADMMKKLLVFSRYSGIGAKTAMGMGGVEITNIH